MATDAKPPVELALTWEGDLRFNVRAGDIETKLDSRSVAGPSPMQSLAAALAACMGMDVVHILQRGRHPLERLSVRVSGRRAPDEPRRFEEVSVHFDLAGDVPRPAIDRALALSRDKYCSVWHSLRPDIELILTYDLL